MTIIGLAGGLRRKLNTFIVKIENQLLRLFSDRPYNFELNEKEGQVSSGDNLLQHGQHP